MSSKTPNSLVTAVANELLQVVEASSANLRRLDEAETSLSRSDGKWSKKQIIGHLIDSAANNHQRFVRAQETDELVFPKYEQEHWVASQNYNESSWSELIEFWRLYNRHLAQVMRQIPEEKLNVICKIGPYEPVTLGFLVEDYLVHLKHHLAQIDVL